MTWYTTLMKSRWKSQIGILAFGHGVTDAYGSAFSPLLPALVAKLALTETDVGILVAVLSVGTSLTQVLFGYLADRIGKPVWLVLGPAMGAIFMSALGLASSFPMLLAFLFWGGCGIAAYHPQAAAAAGRVPARHRGFGLSMCTVGSAGGFACGPLWMGRLGLEDTYWAVFPGLILSALLYWALFQRRLIPFPEAQRKRPDLLAAIRPNVMPLLWLFLIVVFRACTSIAYVAFLPLFLEERGLSGFSNYGIVSLFLFASAFGSFIGGALSDHMDRRHLLMLSLVGAAPFLFLAPFGTGWQFGLLLLIGGFVLASSQPVNIVLGQQILPENASVASSFMMGLAWGIGGLLNIPIGGLAEMFGREVAIRWLPAIPLAATLFVLLLPARYGRGGHHQTGILEGV